jgi:hypothetical protein
MTIEKNLKVNKQLYQPKPLPSGAVTYEYLTLGLKSLSISSPTHLATDGLEPEKKEAAEKTSLVGSNAGKALLIGVPSQPTLKNVTSNINEKTCSLNINKKAMEIKHNNEKVLNYSFNKDRNSKMINSISIGGTTSPKNLTVAYATQKHNLAAYLKKQNSLDSEGVGSEWHKGGPTPSSRASHPLAAGQTQNENQINWIILKDLQIILTSCFKTMCSLISNVKLKVTNDKVVIELFYHILIPDANIFSLFSRIFFPKIFGARLPAVAAIDELLALEGGMVTPTKKKDKVRYKKFDSDSILKDKASQDRAFSLKKLDKLKKRNKLIRLLKKKKIANSIKLQLTENLLNISKNNVTTPGHPVPPFFVRSPGPGGGAVEKDLLKLNLFSLNYLNIIRFKFLAFLLNGIFNRPIVFECIRLHHSDAESNILAQLLILILKKKNIRNVINKLFNKNKVKDINFMKLQPNWKKSNRSNNGKFVNSHEALVGLGYPTPLHINGLKNLSGSDYIPVFISGLYIHINGRLMREPIIPRLTTKKFEKGAIATGKVSYLDQTNITHKNRKGSFTLKITFAQNCI